MHRYELFRKTAEGSRLLCDLSGRTAALAGAGDSARRPTTSSPERAAVRDPTRRLRSSTGGSLGIIDRLWDLCDRNVKELARRVALNYRRVIRFSRHRGRPR